MNGIRGGDTLDIHIEIGALGVSEEDYENLIDNMKHVLEQYKMDDSYLHWKDVTK